MEAVQGCICWGGVNQGWWTEVVAKAVGDKREAWKMIEGFRDRGEQSSTGLRHLYGQKKTTAKRAVDRARGSMEEDLYRKLDEWWQKYGIQDGTG